MENDENVSKSSLIPLLIKYKECIGKTFPISKVNHLTTDIIIERLRECIDNNIRYESKYIVYNDREKLLTVLNHFIQKEFPLYQFSKILNIQYLITLLFLLYF